LGVHHLTNAALVRLFALAAAQNFASAETNLGFYYEHGCAVPCSLADAVRLYRAAADQDFGVAAANLGNLYQDVRGVPRDLNMAVFWYQRAARQGDAKAIEALRCLGYPA
jgi:TPR repeat protein